MSNLKANCKKSLVRNTQQRLPKTVVTLQQSQPLEFKDIKKPDNPKAKVDLGVPKINSSQTILKKIKAVKETKVVTLPDAKEKNKTLQQKITKQMNYANDQHMFRNLIPITSKTVQQPSLTSSRPTATHKDPEPQLEDFVTRKTLPDYTYKIDLPGKTNKTIREYDGFKMYKMIQKW